MSWAGACTVGDGASGSVMKDGADIDANETAAITCAPGLRSAREPWRHTLPTILAWSIRLEPWP